MERIEVLGMGLCFSSVLLQEIFPLTLRLSGFHPNAVNQLLTPFLLSTCSNQLREEVYLMVNGPYSYSRYWPGTSLQVRLTRGVFSNVNDINLFSMIFPHMSLHCKLVPVQYREYHINLCNDIPLHEPPLQASSSPIPRI